MTRQLSRYESKRQPPVTLVQGRLQIQDGSRTRLPVSSCPAMQFATPLPSLPSVHDRDSALEKAATDTYDVAVVGGGITGAGILLEAAARGLSAVLLEKRDFASGTSGRSSRLIHGGLRYLESLDFGVVAESLRERRRLLAMAPHLVWAAPFVIPFFKGSYFSRRKTLVEAGLVFYDALASSLTVMRHRRGTRTELAELIPGIDPSLYDEGVIYWDAIHDDVRTCLAVLKTASAHGALPLNYCEVVDVEPAARGVQISVIDRADGLPFHVRARAVVNATGAAAGVVAARLGLGVRLELVPARGAHLVVRKSAYSGRAAVLLPVESDKRFVFVIPNDTGVLVGTTDTPHDGSLDEPMPQTSDLRYIADAFSSWAEAPLGKNDVTGAFAGLRPLVTSDHSSQRTSEISRKHVILAGARRSVTVTGGKYTAFRSMAEEAVDLVSEVVLEEARVPSPTRRLSLAGSCSFEWFARAARELCPGLPVRHLRILWRRYGADGLRVLRYQSELSGGVVPDNTSPGCIEGQVAYAVRHEAALGLEDVMLRRLRLGTDDIETASRLAGTAEEIMRAELSRKRGSAAMERQKSQFFKGIEARRAAVAEAIK